MAQRFRDRWFLALAGVLLAGLIAGGAFVLHRARAAKSAPPPVAEVEAPSGTEVSFDGIAQARLILPLGAPVAGTLEAGEVEPGGEVASGQLLGRIRNDGLETEQRLAEEANEQAQQRVNNFESALIAARLEASRAQAEASRTQTEFDRVEKLAQREEMLFREGATAKMKYEKAQRDLQLVKLDRDSAREMARQADDRVAQVTRDLEAARKIAEEKSDELEQSKEDAASAEVRSPVDGLLLSARARAGDQVEPSMRDLFQLTPDPSQLTLPVEPDPKVAARLVHGLPAAVQIPELSPESYPAELRRKEDGAFTVDFASPLPAVKPGTNVSVRIKLP